MTYENVVRHGPAGFVPPALATSIVTVQFHRQAD
jgi:hypothetical protein